MGAWIETDTNAILSYVAVVAPRVGAWIETGKEQGTYRKRPCRTPRGCVD